jgi:hypothetical protein
MEDQERGGEEVHQERGGKEVRPGYSLKWKTMGNEAELGPTRATW